MIRPTFYGMEISKTGLYMSQLSMDVTAHNIANVDTPGYTRQRVVTQSIDPYNALYRLKPLNTYKVGGGVELKILDQIRDEFLDLQFRNEQSNYSTWATRAQGLGYIQPLYDEYNNGGTLRTAVQDLFDKFTQLSQNTSDLEVREVVRQSAQSVIEAFQRSYDSLLDQREMQNQAVKGTADAINSITEQIALLNKTIQNYEYNNPMHQANDLRDKRNLLLDQLSALINVDYNEKDGYLNISTGGVSLVDGLKVNKLNYQLIDDPLTGQPNSYYQLSIDTGVVNPDYDATQAGYYANLPEVAIDPSYAYGTGDPVQDALIDGLSDGKIDLSYTPGVLAPGDPGYDEVQEYLHAQLPADFDYTYDPTTTPTTMKILDVSNVTGGEMAAHLQLRDYDGGSDPGIPYFMEQMNRLAKALVDSINAIHSTGYTFPADENGFVSRGPGTPDGPVNFFDDFTSISNLKLSDEILASAYNIAASDEQINLTTPGDTPEQAKGGNNKIALALAGLLDSTTISDIGSIFGFMNKMVVEVATATKHATDISSALGANVLNIDNNRTSISGVSLDEEMTNMLKYQHSYNASSRMITTMDEMLDTLISRMGVVGRS